MFSFWRRGGVFVVFLFFFLLLLLNMHNFPFLVRTRMFYGSLYFILFDHDHEYRENVDVRDIGRVL